jgi:hypothetical protein
MSDFVVQEVALGIGSQRPLRHFEDPNFSGFDIPNSQRRFFLRPKGCGGNSTPGGRKVTPPHHVVRGKASESTRFRTIHGHQGHLLPIPHGENLLSGWIDRETTDDLLLRQHQVNGVALIVPRERPQSQPVLLPVGD